MIQWLISKTCDIFYSSFLVDAVCQTSCLLLHYTSDTNLLFQKLEQLYILNIIERWCLYAFLSFFTRYEFILFALPFIQNTLLQSYYNTFSSHKKIFCTYIMSLYIKNILENITTLQIKNKYVFKIYKIISITNLYTCLKNFVIITLFLYVKNYDYYMFHSIKFGYYLMSKYKFQVFNKSDALKYIQNIVIHKKWDQLVHIDLIHALIILNEPKHSIKWYILAFGSFYTIISITVLSLYLKLILFTFIIKHFQVTKPLSTFLLFSGIFYNQSPLFLSIFLLLYKHLEFISTELIFYFTHLHSFSQIMIYYSYKS